MPKLSFLKPISLNGKTRFGRNSDGGYVIYKRLLTETDVLVTYGVGWDSSFEEDFSKNTGKPVLMFDPSMFTACLINFGYLSGLLLNLRIRKCLLYISRLLIWPIKLILLRRKNIRFVNEGISVKKNGKYDTFEHHLQRFNLKDKQILLKVDIEGGEYNIFTQPGIYRSLQNVNQIVIEFHDMKYRLRHMQIILNKLKHDFDIVHIHANNYGQTFVLYDSSNKFQNDVLFSDALELTFVRRGKINDADLTDKTESYPVKDLDFPNNPLREDFVIEFF